MSNRATITSPLGASNVSRIMFTTCNMFQLLINLSTIWLLLFPMTRILGLLALQWGHPCTRVQSVHALRAVRLALRAQRNFDFGVPWMADLPNNYVGALQAQDMM